MNFVKINIESTKEKRGNWMPRWRRNLQMSKQIMGQQEVHGAPFLVAGYGKVQVSFSERRRGVVLKINGPNIFTAKCTFPTCLFLVYTHKSNFGALTANRC